MDSFSSLWVVADCVPETTSSPWAPNLKSMTGSFSPFHGFLVNATPAPELRPMFPKTIACTVIAVPRRLFSGCTRRKDSALGFVHERSTAIERKDQLVVDVLRENFFFVREKQALVIVNKFPETR